jgi:hypothetical protein
MAYTEEQPTLPGLSDRDMAWLDPSVIELSLDYNLGETSGELLLERVRSVEAEIAQTRKGQ